jgi:hypothetical protein
VKVTSILHLAVLINIWNAKKEVREEREGVKE